ncbi:hypothetical protein SNE35_18155 [Paucibacter sp. R3-3]|uniref:Uncharacterized protein n=1 Tax=Roseateles agri TaxID=3098619 RepID=A0ABU5DJG9_9BURK|nr:hypothetical protein [Paucibacter sp. R3-3]MDY0746441.1 hypothetical protein [Paucibacter sp. R3-3]
MTTALVLPAEHLARLATQIGHQPALKLAPTDLGHRRLAEHFELWTLFSFDPLAPGQRLESIAMPTGLMHHQIRSRGRAVQYALSADAKDGHPGRALQAVFTSPNARRIERAIQYVDELPHVGGERARLLFIPSRQIYALWLYTAKSDRIVIASKPNMGRALAYRAVHPVDTFLASLARRPPIRARIERPSPKQPVSVPPVGS